MLSRFFALLAGRHPYLYWFGWLNLLLFVVAGTMHFLDPTLILGINAWIKPMKFALSIAIYAWTFGWVLAYSAHPKANRIIAIGLMVTMTVEVVLIFLQAFRGTTSHFNVHTLLDGIIFGVMGIFIGLNTLINLYTVLIFAFGKTSLTGPSLLAWRAGLILFLLGGISGGWMVGQLAHTVGAPDGGPGLPFVNWSTVAGDIRSAHFATLHGLQILPLVAFMLTRMNETTAPRWTTVTIMLYGALCVYLHVLAWMGIPVIPI